MDKHNSNVIIDLDILSNRAILNFGRAIELTSIEFRILLYLKKHHRRVVGRDEIITSLYMKESTNKGRDSRIDVSVCRIKSKIGFKVINTISGIGYQYTVPSLTGSHRFCLRPSKLHSPSATIFCHCP